MSRLWTACAALTLLLHAAGCSAWVHASGGVASNLSSRAPAALGGVLDLEYGGAIASPAPLWPSLNLHVRGGPDLVQVAPSLSLRGALRSPITPVYGVGARFLSFEANDGFGFGMFSPYAELGAYVALFSPGGHLETVTHGVGGGNGLVLHADVGYDLRFTHQPNAWWTSVSLGYAVYGFAY